MGKTQGRPFQLSVNASLEAGFQDSRIAPDGGLVELRELGKRFGFLSWLLMLVRQKTTWSPAVISGELWRLLINIGRYREILNLLKLRPFAEIAQKNPGFAFIYLVPNYLARGFTGTECVSCFLHHYRRIHAVLSESVLRQILQGYVTLYEIVEGGNRFAFTMGLPERMGDMEGELSLDLRVDGKKVFNLCFTIVPGWVVKAEVPEILLITHLQGVKGSKTQIKLARNALHDYSPRAMLLAALQGIADAFEISEIGAVCATKQRAYTKECAAILKSGYDEFFDKVGMVKTSAGFYFSPIPIEGKPLASLKGREKSRARTRRAMRQQIQLASAAFLLGAVDRAAHSSSGAVNSSPVPGTVESRPSPIFSPPPDCDLTL